MIQFDKSTEKKAEEYAETHSVFTKELHGNIVADWTAGRNSVKESVELLVRANSELIAAAIAVDESNDFFPDKRYTYADIQNIFKPVREAIIAVEVANDKVKANGDWPLVGVPAPVGEV